MGETLNPDGIEGVVLEDILEGLNDVVIPLGSEVQVFRTQANGRDLVAEADGVAAVAWEIPLRGLDLESFGFVDDDGNGIRVEVASDSIALRGVTFVTDHGDGETPFRRHIDWLDTLHALGVVAMVRPSDDADPTSPPAAPIPSS